MLMASGYTAISCYVVLCKSLSERLHLSQDFHLLKRLCSILIFYFSLLQDNVEMERTDYRLYRILVSFPKTCATLENGYLRLPCSFIHSDHFYSASSSPLPLRSAPDTAWILCRSFTPKHCCLHVVYK